MRTPNDADIIEVHVEDHLVKSVKALGGVALKFTVPGRRGYPDRLCLILGRPGFFVELKRPVGGRFAMLQKERHKELRAAGARVYLAKNNTEVDAILEKETDEI